MFWSLRLSQTCEPGPATEAGRPVRSGHPRLRAGDVRVSGPQQHNGHKQNSLENLSITYDREFSFSTAPQENFDQLKFFLISHPEYKKRRIRLRIISKMTWPEDKEFTGCSRSPTMASTPIYRPESVGSGDNSSAVRAGIFTGRSAWGSTRRVLFPQSPASLARSCMPRSPGSAAATEYVWKEDTRVANTQFELGVRPIKRNDPHDWDLIWEMAVAGDLGAIPAQIRVQSYRTLRAIGADFAKPVGMVRTCQVYWGRTGTGKSRRAWEEAGLDAYVKDPNTKFWCGYRGQGAVVIDEFRGRIDVSHLLRWLDRYPVNVEIKGSSCPLAATAFWITSNVDPRQWYPDLDSETLSALLRRFNITNFL